VPTLIPRKIAVGNLIQRQHAPLLAGIIDPLINGTPPFLRSFPPHIDAGLIIIDPFHVALARHVLQYLDRVLMFQSPAERRVVEERRIERV
jgi:hypothetical protein